MNPALDPPPVAGQLTVGAPATPTATAAANPTPAQSAAHNHPPYSEMISAAITALNERGGSSKRAIAKYIDTRYSGLPSTHSALLTHHLKRLKSNGRLLMVKHSYKLPSRSTAAAVNGAVNAVAPDPASAGSKRRPGRPSKPKPGTAHITVGPVNGGLSVRGRGRPPKQGGLKLQLGRSPKSGGAAGVGRSRGRPRKIVAAALAAAREKGSGRPRGRPPKPINVVEGLAPGVPVGGGGLMAAPVAVGVASVGLPPPVVAGGVAAPVAGKRKGRPQKAGGEAKKPRNMNAAQPKKLRKLSGKPLGRPRKDASALVTRTPDSQLLVAYLDLKAKLENLQSIIQQTSILIRPSLTTEAAINALQELELVAMNANAPPNVQNQQQQTPPPQRAQPQPQT